MLLGYVRPDARHPEAAQVAALIRFGVEESRIYVEKLRNRGDTYPQRAKLVKACRSKSDKVVVVDFHRLASTVDDLADAADQILKRAGAIIEARTGRECSQVAAVRMSVESANFYAARGMSSEAARRIGTEGGIASPATKPAQGRMPEDQARKIWLERPHTETNDEALARINADKRYQREWLLSSASRRLGPRGSKPGRKANLDSG